MADDPMPAPAPTEGFRDIATAAGNRLKEALEKGITPATKTSAFLSFEIESVKSDSPDDPLDRVMKRFENQEFKRLQIDGQLEWRVIRLMTQTKSFEKNTYGNKTGNPYILALFTGGEDYDKIGRSFSLNENFTVEEGDIYIGYEVKKA